jgi:ABC-2 type transport system permease protein
MHRLNLVATYLRVGVLNELQYRANFFTSLLQALLSLTVTIASLAIVFSHTETLNGWQAWELIVLVGVYYLMRGFIETFVQPSMESFLRAVRMGTLDFTLTKPEDSQLLVSVRSIAIWNLVNVFIGFGLLLFGVARGGAQTSAADVAGFLLMLAAGAVIVYSFWLMLATIAFWFVRIENILVVFESMYEAGRWPVMIYPPILRILLTFVVPVAFAVTVPAQALVGRATLWTIAGALLLAVAIFALARWFWLLGVRQYAGASA